MSGAMLLGSSSFITIAKNVRQQLGATPFSYFPVWLDCERRFKQYVLQDLSHPDSFYQRYERMKGLCYMLREEELLGGDSPVKLSPRIPQSCMVLYNICTCSTSCPGSPPHRC